MAKNKSDFGGSEFIRTATFHTERKVISMWVSPNTHGFRDCVDAGDAKRMISDSGVPQTLRVQP